MINKYIDQYIGFKPDLGILILRIGLGATFALHGYSKFSGGIENVEAFFAGVGIPQALFFSWVVTLVELIGGIALILGVWSRFCAILLAIILGGSGKYALVKE